MRKFFNPEDSDNSDDFMLPEDADVWEMSLLKHLRKLAPKDIVYLPKGVKAPAASSIEKVFYEEDPELFPAYKRLGKELIELARKLDENAKFDIDICRTTLEVIIFNTSSFGFGGDETSVLFKELLDKNVAISIEPGYEFDTITITFHFPNAWRIVK